MARRNIAVGGLTLAFALLLFAHAGDAQTAPRPWNRNLPGPPQSASPPPPPSARGAQGLPDYYLERGGSVTAPRAPVNPGGIAASLQARGFRDIGPVQQRGNTLIVPHATGPSGEKVQLVIGPNGEILGVRVIGPGGR